MVKHYKWKVLGIFLLIAIVVGGRFMYDLNRYEDARKHRSAQRQPQSADPQKPADRLATGADYYDAIVVRADAYIIIIDGIETQYSEIENVKLYLDIYAPQLTGKRFNIISKGNQSLGRVTAIADILKERNLQVGQILY